MKVEIRKKDGKVFVFAYFRRQRCLDFWELYVTENDGRVCEKRLKHTRQPLGKAYGDVVSYILQNFPDIEKIVYEDKL